MGENHKATAPKGIFSKARQVKKWLTENVTVTGDVTTVVLSKFTWDQEEYDGHFYVEFDGVEYPYCFPFSLGGADGRTVIYMPMFTSPLGAPASFPAIDMPEHVKEAIDNEIRKLFPRITPFGRNQKTGVETTHGTPMQERISDPDALLETVNTITEPDFKVDIDLSV